MNTLYYGDNLPILRTRIPDASADLVYLDPPFNSTRSYNVFFKDESVSSYDAQLTAFDDTRIGAQPPSRSITRSPPASIPRSLAWSSPSASTFKKVKHVKKIQVYQDFLFVLMRLDAKLLIWRFSSK